MKRFTLRKVKQHSYSRQGWILYDREWAKNFEAAGGRWRFGTSDKEYKYIDNAHSKEVAQYWADWLNANRAEEFGHKITIPMNVFTEGLKLYH